MITLENMQPKEVFDFFKEISSIPHGSGNTKMISDYLVKFAEKRNLQYYQDDINNVIIVKEAAPGYENSEPIMLQGHIDMVTEKTPDSDIDMEKDGLTLAVDGELLYAENTTLGGDDGIAVAMALAVLDSDKLAHPKLQCIFTVDEEIGLLGAEAIDVSMIEGNKMINIDSEEEGIFTVSCAGGITAEAIVPIQRKAAEGLNYKIVIDGLLGGHSGIEINKERGNANILMGRVLYNIEKETKMVIISMSGGTKDNAICKLAEAEVVVPIEKKEVFEAEIEKFGQILQHEFNTTDPDISLKAEFIGDKTADALDGESTYKVITYLMNSPSGIQNMSMDIEGLVETSLNLGALLLKKDELSAIYAVRSSADTRRDYICQKIENLCDVLGGNVIYSGAYPGWEYRPDSPLRDICIRVFETMYDKKPKIEAIHAGLECGLFAGKLGGDIDAISIGPDMSGVHTTDERLSIPSVERTWNLLCEILKECK